MAAVFSCLRSFFSLSLVGFLIMYGHDCKAQNPIFKNFRIEQGLLSNECHDLLADSKGFIWIATDAGLCRYQGKQFKSFGVDDGMPESTILKVFEDRHQRIWFTTLSSRIGYIENDQIHVLEGNFRAELNIYHGENFAYSLHVDEGDTLWVGTIFTGLLFKVAPPYTTMPKAIDMKGDFVIEFNQEGDYIYGTKTSAEYNRLIFPFEYHFTYIKKWQNEKKSEYRFQTSDIQPRKHILRQGPNDFIIGGRYQLFRFKNGQVSDMLYDKVAFATIDKKKRLWIGLEEKGLYAAQPHQGIPSIKLLFKSKYVTAVCQDFENGFWVTSIYDGLSFIPSFGFQKIKTNHEFGDLYEWHDKKIVVNEKPGNILIIDPVGTTRVLPKNVYSCIAYPEQNMIYYFNMTHLNGVQNDQYVDLNGKTPVSGHFDAHGDPKLIYFKFKKFYKQGKNLYISDNYNIIRIRGKNYPIRLFSGLFRINQFCVDEQGMIWIATNEGLVSYHLQSKKTTIWGDQIREMKQRFDHIAYDRNGNIWLGTKGNGLYCFDKKRIIRHYLEKSGLSSNVIRKLYLDQEGYIWIATNKGLCYISINHRSKPIILQFLEELQIGTINDILRIDHQLYLSTTRGCYGFDIHEIKRKFKQPSLPVYIHSVQDNQQHKINHGQILNANNNSIRFQFQAITFNHQNDIQYRYKILGAEENWHLSKGNSINYSALPPGKYAFAVQAITSFGRHGAMTRFPFTILSPIWQRWWFLTGCVLLIGSIVYLLVNLRLRQRDRQKQEEASLQIAMAELEAKALRSQMNPHFMFNSFNSIQSFMLQNETKLANYYLGKFSRLMRRILESSKLDKISVKDEMELLENYLELEQMRCNHSFDFEIKQPGHASLLWAQIPIMVIQPYVENAVLHGVSALEGRQGLIRITFENIQNYLRCTIEDNGIGREASREINNRKERFHRSVSTSLNQERIELYNKIYRGKSQVQIIDLRDTLGAPAGTKVILDLPILEES